MVNVSVTEDDFVPEFFLLNKIRDVDCLQQVMDIMRCNTQQKNVV